MAVRSTAATGRRFLSVTDIRHEVFRLYHAVRLKRLDSLDGLRRVRILEVGAKLMMESEPELELRKLREEHEALQGRCARLEAMLDNETEAAAWPAMTTTGAAKPN